ATIGLTVSNLNPSLSGVTISQTAINEGGSVTVNGTVSDVGTLDVETVTISWGTGEGTSTPALTATATPGVYTFSATHAYGDDNPTGTASDRDTIGVSAADDDTGTTTPVNFALTVNNVAPVLSGVGINNATINENGSVTVSGTVS